jgi:acetyl esterase
MSSTLTPEVRDLLDRLEALGLPPLHSMTPSGAREMRKATASLAAGLEPEPVYSIRDTSTPGPSTSLSTREYTPEGWAPGVGGVVVYFHGGGWVMGDLNTHDAPCRGLANASGMRVVAIDYRLAPEHPYPAANDDAWALLSSIAEMHEGPLFVGGDSAGGHIATCIAARARGSELHVAGQLLVYPVTDLSSFDTESYSAYAEGHWLTKAAMEWFRGHYLTPDTDRSDADVSPLLRDDLSGMPPAMIITAECDVLLDEGIRYSDRLREAGIDVEQRTYDGVIHGFWALAGLIPEGRRAIEDAGRWLQAQVGA